MWTTFLTTPRIAKSFREKSAEFLYFARRALSVSAVAYVRRSSQKSEAFFQADAVGQSRAYSSKALISV